MNNIISKLNILDLRFQANRKTIVSLVAFILIAGTLLSVALPFNVFAQAPRFNIFTPYTHTQAYNRDYYLLDMRNETKNTSWNDPISADAGDVLMFSVYYHNGVNYTTANNTRMRVSIPSTTGTQIVSTAYLWADNAENATASNPLTETGTVNLSSSQKLEYITGSAKWYPNQADWRYNSPTAFPSGQSGDEIVGSGVNIGNIEGCWEFSGYVNFRVRVASGGTQNQDIAIEKTVRNLSEGQNYWSESINARPNQRVAFQIILRATGNASANNVYLRDALPDRTSYSSGSTKIDGSSANDNITSSSGLYIGSISAGSSKTITIEATIHSDSSFSSGSTYLTNYAYVWADNISQKNDTAQIIVNRDGPTTTYPDLLIYKTVRNISRGEYNWQETTNANSGDKVAFSLRVESIGNSPAYNVIISDTLPSGLSYVSGSARVEGSYSSDGITSGGINIGSLNQYQSKTITFEANVNSDSYLSYGQNTLTNYGYVRADNISQRSDTAQVVVNRQTTPTQTTWTLRKTVYNSTNPNGTDTDNNAKPGDTLRYTFTYYNSGNTTINNARIIDTLPSNVSFINTENNGSFDSANRQIIWNVGSINADGGRSGSVSYNVRVDNISGSATITNSGSARSDNAGEITSNEVRTYVSQQPAPTPAPVVYATTGSDDFSGTGALAAGITALAIFALYLIRKNFAWFTNLRLNATLWQLK
jgi:uncharacterized repeat protein (TIGR01451 family)